MDELKSRAGEKLEALHVAAKTAAGNGKTKVTDVYQQTAEAIQRIREAFLEIWQHEMIAEGRARVALFARDSARRLREGAPLLSPRLLYEELLTLFKDRVWRRTVVVFALGAACGCLAGVALGARAAARAGGPHARALLAQRDQSVVLVEDAQAPGAESDEVLIRVQAFAVNPLDRAVLRGHAATLRALLRRSSLTVGRGFAGVVLDVGRDVTQLEMGDEVWGCVSEWAGGAASELLTIRSTRVSKRPTTLSANEAASLPWSASLALAAMEKLRLPEKPHTRIAICGASSAEGCLLIQLLSSRGVHITAIAPRHALSTLSELGANDTIDLESEGAGVGGVGGWAALVALGGRRGPWDAALACQGAPPSLPRKEGVLKSTAPRAALVDLRPPPPLSDRLPAPLTLVFAVTFYTYRVLRWLIGKGSHTDWLEDKHRLTPALEELAQMVDKGLLAPVLDKVYLPQDFESALAHACSDDAIGATVIRFP